MKIKNQDILNLWKTLSNINLSGSKFSYAVARNLSIIKPIVDALETAIKPKKEYLEHMAKQEEIAVKYSEKDEKGNPVILDGFYKISDELGAENEFKVLKENNAEIIKDFAKQTEEYNSLLKDDVEVNLHMIDFENIPDAINTVQMKGIYPIIQS